MSVLGLAAGFLTLLLAGFGATLLLSRDSQSRNLLECLCLSWLLGSGIISFFLWGAGFFLSGIPLQGAVTAGALAICVAAWRTGSRIRFTLPIPAGAVEWLLTGVVALEIGAMFLVSLGQTLGWDGSFNWEIKARLAFLNGGVMPAAYYSSDSLANSHPEYPLLVPFTQLWLDLWMGQAHQFWEKAIIPIFNAAGVILLALLGARLSGRRWVGGSVALLLFFSPYLAHGVGSVTSGYLDFPLGALYLAAIGYLLVYETTGEASSLRLYLGALSLLPWLKREGMLLWLVAVLCGIAVIYRRKSGWRFLIGLLPGLLIIVAWQLYLKAVGAAPSHDFMPASLAAFMSHFERVWPICRTLASELAQTERWSIFWWLVAVAFVSRLFRPRRFATLLLGAPCSRPLFSTAALMFSARGRISSPTSKARFLDCFCNSRR